MKEEQITSTMVLWMISALTLFALVIQINALYQEYMEPRQIDYFICCIYLTYDLRWLVEYLSYSGISLAIYALYKTNWKLPKSFLQFAVLFSPIAVLISDHMLIDYIYTLAFESWQVY